MFSLTVHDIEQLPAEAFASPYTIRLAVSAKYACGITQETAQRIYEAYVAGKIQPKECNA